MSYDDGLIEEQGFRADDDMDDPELIDGVGDFVFDEDTDDDPDKDH